MITLLFALVFGPLLAWRVWCLLLSIRAANADRRPPVTARMPPSRPSKIEPYDVRYARNVGWLRRHTGQP